jgi:hypothetical protein
VADRARAEMARDRAAKPRTKERMGLKPFMARAGRAGPPAWG